MPNLQVTVTDFEYGSQAPAPYNVVPLAESFDGYKFTDGSKLDAVEFSYDGGRLSVYVNGVEVVSTFVSHAVNVKLELTAANVTNDND